MDMQRIWEVFWRFLGLGCISFGGPAAHIGYFRATFVDRLHWLDDKAYANLVALSQFLPGPGSSQVGFALGLRRAGLAGGIAAFLGFTLPSFVLMFILASSTGGDNADSLFTAVVAGLKLLAVVVVADAVTGMYKSFCYNALTMTIAVLTAVSIWLQPTLWIQLLVLLAAAAAGVSAAVRENPAIANPANLPPIKIRLWPLMLFMLLFLGLPLITFSAWFGLADSFFRAGSLVFGGGHVVLPLLQQMIGDSLSADRFLTGYAAAQAVPGPMFTLATFLGTELSPGAAIWGALLATLAVFLPGFLLLLGLQNTWETLAMHPRVSGAVMGVNAAVVGLLIAALYSPVFTSAVHRPVDMALVLMGYMLLTRIKVPIVVLVIFFALAGVLVADW